MSKDKPKPSKETKPQTEEINLTLPSGKPVGISLKINDDGIALGIRYGCGSENMPLFGIAPGGLTGNIGTKGGGPGNGGCP